MIIFTRRIVRKSTSTEPDIGSLTFLGRGTENKRGVVRLNLRLVFLLVV